MDRQLLVVVIGYYIYDPNNIIREHMTPWPLSNEMEIDIQIKVNRFFNSYKIIYNFADIFPSMIISFLLRIRSVLGIKLLGFVCVPRTHKSERVAVPSTVGVVSYHMWGIDSIRFDDIRSRQLSTIQQYRRSDDQHLS